MSECNIDASLLPKSCFHTLKDNPKSEDDLFEGVELSSSDGIEVQVAKIFTVGLEPASEMDVVWHGEMPPPKATPEASIACMPEPISAASKWWQPPATRAATQGGEVARGSGLTTPDQKQVVCIPPDVPAQFLSLSPADYEYVASLGGDAFVTLSLGRHKQSWHKCVIKVVSNAIIEEESVIHAVLKEQHIMHEASRYPFLSGLMAFFHSEEGFYLLHELFFLCAL